MTSIYDWDTTAASNTTVGGVNIDEGMAPDKVNNAMRAMMAEWKKFQLDTGGTLVTGGSSNAYTLTTNSAHASYVDGEEWAIVANFSNTGISTINRDGLGAKSLRRFRRDGNDATLVANDIVVNGHYTIRYDASLGWFALLNPTPVALDLSQTWSGIQKFSTSIYVNENEVQIGSADTDDGVTINLKHIQISNTDSATGLFRRQGSNGTLLDFYRNNTSVGSISVTLTATAYNTSSDGRLKTNDRPIAVSDCGSIIDKLRPVTFDWTHVEGAKGVGFIAQELYKIVPDAVTPGDDDTRRTFGEAGFEPWRADYSKLIPVLVAEVKGLRSRVAVLEGNQ